MGQNSMKSPSRSGSVLGGNQQSGDIDPVAVDGPILLLDHITEIDVDAELHAPVLGELAMAPAEFALDLDRTVDRFHGAWEFCKDAVPCGIKLIYRRELRHACGNIACFIERAKGSCIVVGHELGIASGVG